MAGITEQYKTGNHSVTIYCSSRFGQGNWGFNEEDVWKRSL